MITKDMIIEEIVRKHPETLAIFKKHGLDCMGCQIAAFEEVEHGADVHKVDLGTLLKELNEKIRLK
jgi:hybrid cluster-associated redox disulfide protein